MQDLWQYLVPCYQTCNEGSPIQEGAEGNDIYTQYGKTLDLNGGYWTVILGHKRKELRRISSKGFFAHPYGELSRPASELAEILCKRTGYAKALFATSGTDAVDSAIRLAWQCTMPRNKDKKNILAIKTGFHGTSAVTLAASGFPYRRQWIPVDFNVNLLSSWVTDASWEYECARKKLSSQEIDWQRLSAFLFEPILGVGGVREVNPAVYRVVAEQCRKADALVIADEVTTGIGRTGSFLCSENLSPKPDVVCLGKAITNGDFPLSVVLISEKVWTRIDSASNHPLEKYLYGFTYGGHPTGCLIAKKVLEMVDTNCLAEVRAKGDRLYSKLTEALQDEHVVKSVRGKGLMQGIELESGALAEKTYYELLHRGVRVGQEGRVLTLLPPYTVSLEEFDEAVYKIADTLTILQ